MTVRNLSALLQPQSVVLIAQTEPLGLALADNLTRAHFRGPVLPVSPFHQSIGGVLAYPSIEDLPFAPDLAVIPLPMAAPAPLLPELIASLGARGVRGVLLLGEGQQLEPTLIQEMTRAARPTMTRLIGPNSLGVMVPAIGLNASFAQTMALPGSIACVTQSGSVAASLLDWGAARGIGFSHMIALGDMADADLGDMLDYLANDPDVDAICLHVDHVTAARKFLSAARAAARLKPVMAVKAARLATPDGLSEQSTHSAALASPDEAYDAAFRRAGVLRVASLDDVFATLQTFARAPFSLQFDPTAVGRDRIAVITNGDGLGRLAVDAIANRTGGLAALSEVTLSALSEILPRGWPRANPIDIRGDATPDRYAAVLEILLSDASLDAIVVLNAPTALSDGIAAARRVAEIARPNGARARVKPVFTAWVGGKEAEAAREILSAAQLPTFATPEAAIRGAQRRFDAARAQAELLRAPPAAAKLPGSAQPPDRARVQALIQAALAAGRTALDESEAKEALSAYGAPITAHRRATSVAEVAGAARDLLAAQLSSGRVAVKILSPDVAHKSDVGGVALDLKTPEAAEAAASLISERLLKLRPGARIDGFSVQEMVRRSGAYELFLGAAVDPVFGPVILFGQGGVAVEVIADAAIALTPLDLPLARQLIERTRVYRQLKGYRHRPAVNLDAVADVLVKLSQLIVEQPSIVEMDINPLLADEQGVVALDARIRLTADQRVPMALSPYPTELERLLTLPTPLPEGDQFLLRPVRPDDAPRFASNFKKLMPEDVRSRFFTSMKELPATLLVRLTQIDYDREIALIAVPPPKDGVESDSILGVVRLIADPDRERAEFGVIVRSDAKGHGLGGLLMRAILDYARETGVGRIEGSVFRDNAAMLRLASGLGFTVKTDPDDPSVMRVILPLR
jgi:acetyltransferase